ncbi:MAG: hypothetical protein WCS99_03870 [Limisphaerales bacterium]
MSARLLTLARCLLAVLALGSALLGAGCNTAEPDNMSTRPWNSPKGWEGGIPGMMYDRR